MSTNKIVYWYQLMPFANGMYPISQFRYQINRQLTFRFLDVSYLPIPPE